MNSLKARKAPAKKVKFLFLNHRLYKSHALHIAVKRTLE